LSVFQTALFITMRLFRFIFSYISLLSFLIPATAQQENLNFTSLTSKDGLSSNTINAILKDSYGLMWFATEDGLNKFDGTNFTVYRHKPGDPSSLGASEILALSEDKAGNLWVGTGGGSLSLYDRKKDAFTNFPADNKPNTIGNSVILGVCSDLTGKIWIAHYGGINVLDPSTKHISTISMNTGGSIAPFSLLSSCVFEDNQQQIWIGTNEGLFQYNTRTNSFKQYQQSKADPYSLSGNRVLAVSQDGNGNLWIGTNNGLSMLPKGKTIFTNYLTSKGDVESPGSISVNSVAVDGDEIWAGTNEGLKILNIRTNFIESYHQDYRNIYSLTATSVKSIYIDKQGMYWLGTVGGGINKYDNKLNVFNWIKSNPFDPQGLKGPIVSSFYESGVGKVFVGTNGNGVGVFDVKTKLFRHINITSRRKSTNKEISAFALSMPSANKLMVGTYADGLFVVDAVSGNYRQLMQGPNLQDLNSNDIFCVKSLNNGNVWVGTNGAGINVLDKDDKVIVRYVPNPKAANDVLLPINGYIRDIEEDRNGNVWIATHGGGIAVFYSNTKKFEIYNTNNSKLSNDKVQTLAEDSHGQIWAGTFGGGVALFNPQTKQFIVFTEKDGLQNSNIYKILEDGNGLIWASTNRGISSIDINTKKITNYNYHNGVQNNNFFAGAGMRSSGGDLFFGGLEGFNYFNPKDFKKNNNIPSVLLTDLKISHQSVTASEDGPIKEHISVAKEINLDYKQNFVLSFVGLNYTSPERNQYAYILEGFDKDWNNVGSTTSASYTNLDPGEYTFRVKASNNDGVWNPEGTSIKIYVRPPFWQTIYAYIFYVLVIIGLLLYLRHKGIQKLRRKFASEQEQIKIEQERKEIERVRELDRLKIKFLTNISHEFRTPISLILGPVDKLLKTEYDSNKSGQLQMVKRNGKRLLNLVNQLLDFRKMEEHELTLQQVEGELISFVKETFDSFKDLAERKKIEFIFTSNLSQLHTFFDYDKIERILFNVLSNAFKFTPSGGQVKLEIERIEKVEADFKTWLSIKVSDSGVGIPNDQKDKIFERFFQHTTAAGILNQGTGIGLSITKEFVKMHGGDITVESEVGKGTMFDIQLPFVPSESEASAPNMDELQEETELTKEAEELENAELVSEGSAKKRKNEEPSILIVEDTEDFRIYLKDNLKSNFKVFEAADGKEGWQKALALHPQLIVSDISMPFMDGIELCRKIKSDKRTNHIPVILLTALTAEEYELKGLKTGANDYITKPFNLEVLNAKIRNLLDLNTSLKNTYSKQVSVNAPQVEIESDNEKLLKNIRNYIDENLTNPQLSVEELSKHIGMSRSSLYSKLLEVTGQTPVEYIRTIKLEKAAILLEKSDMNITQVGYSVGFTTPTYFGKSFKAKFGMLPSEYVTKMRKDRHLH
jgi:signal transduction histidine kinase/ligand-binding sensor domain-containing protein/DNA-binding response OmpR family regulator